MVTLRTIKPSDYQNVGNLIFEAFVNTGEGYGSEGELVANLRKNPSYQDYFEVVVLKNNAIVGHGLLSEVYVCKEGKKLSTGLCLAPLAVLPKEQNQGIGAKILTELEIRAKNERYPFINILGHPGYYAKFNYELASHYGIYPPFSVPDDSYFIKELKENSLANIQGTIQYLDAFNH